jgi:integrase
MVRNGVGKAKRDDVIALHPQVVRALETIRPPNAMPTARVFWSLPQIRSFYRDLQRAREVWMEEATTDDERTRREESDFLAQRDASGRWADFHSLRRSFATALPRANVMPQMAKSLMRHQDMRTTLTHYTDIDLRDMAAAVAGVPDLEGVEIHSLAATSVGHEDQGQL